MKKTTVGQKVLEQIKSVGSLIKNSSKEDIELIKITLIEKKIIAKDTVINKSDDLINAIKETLSKGDDKLMSTVQNFLNSLDNYKGDAKKVIAHIKLDNITKKKIAGKDLTDLKDYLVKNKVILKDNVSDKVNELIPHAINLIQKSRAVIDKKLDSLIDNLYKAADGGNKIMTKGTKKTTATAKTTAKPKTATAAKAKPAAKTAAKPKTAPKAATGAKKVVPKPATKAVKKTASKTVKKAK